MNAKRHIEQIRSECAKLERILGTARRRSMRAPSHGSRLIARLERALAARRAVAEQLEHPQAFPVQPQGLSWSIQR
jgi:hypothetical protein